MKTISIIITMLALIACGGNVSTDKRSTHAEGVQDSNQNTTAQDTNIFGEPLEEGNINGDATGVLPPASSVDPIVNTGENTPTIVPSLVDTTINDPIVDPTIDPTIINPGLTGTFINDTSDVFTDPNLLDTNNISNPLLALLGLGQTSNIPNLDNFIGNVLNGGVSSFPGNIIQSNLFCSALCQFNTGATNGRPLLQIMTRIRQPICGC